MNYPVIVCTIFETNENIQNSKNKCIFVIPFFYFFVIVYESSHLNLEIMKAMHIIQQISLERGIDFPCAPTLDLVPPNGLNVHKREVWNLSITDDPGSYFLSMDKKYNNRAGYYCKFILKDLQEGLLLCRELSQKFGTSPCDLVSSQLLNSNNVLYLAIHIHPEFDFTPTSGKIIPATQEFVLNFS